MPRFAGSPLTQLCMFPAIFPFGGCWAMLSQGLHCGHGIVGLGQSSSRRSKRPQPRKMARKQKLLKRHPYRRYRKYRNQKKATSQGSWRELLSKLFRLTNVQSGANTSTIGRGFNLRQAETLIARQTRRNSSRKMQEIEWWSILNYSCRFEGKIRTHRNENDRRLNKQDQTYVRHWALHEARDC